MEGTSMTRHNLVVPGSEQHTLLPSKSAAHVAIKRGMPCITILVHGVNDVGEAFARQEQGLCAGLNTRLFRKDIKPGQWDLPPEKKSGEKYTASDVNPDPDKVYYQRKPDTGTSTVIPFYWGFREDADNVYQAQEHGEYLDQYGNRIDKRYGKNGGPFANATTNIPDMFGPGFDRNWPVRLADPEEGTHPLLNAPPRKYMVLAAQRLAGLIRIIRKQSPIEPINIVAHSQGCLITLLAHAMLAKEGNDIKADTVILNNPPYSFEETLAERIQTGLEQQTGHAREETLRRIVADYITSSPAVKPPFAHLKTAGDCVVGQDWKPDAREERDNRGKVYLYFSPDDGTVGLPNIQGIGCWGVHEGMRKKLGKRFFQRLFAAPTGSNPDAHEVGAAPYEREINFNWNAGWTRDRKCFINGEVLQNCFKPYFGLARLQNGPIDAAVAVTNRYDKKDREGMLPNESPAQAQARWRNLDGENSYHSGIVGNAVHSEKATAYDICIGISDILKDNDLIWIKFLRAAADWRTNWRGEIGEKIKNDPSFPPPSPELIAMLDGAIDAEERKIIEGNFDYYGVGGKHPGVLPEFTNTCAVKNLKSHVMSQTISQSHAENPDMYP
jgi:pimeloyl-ACP methyl ester carboxylesterase